MKLDLKMPAGQAALVESLIPLLERQHVDSLSVFPYCRPGEPQYWLAFLHVAGERHAIGTPDLRHLGIEEQLEDLLRQLRAFAVDVPPS